MYRALTKDGIFSTQDFEDLMMVDNNMFVPDALTDQDISLSELETQSPIDYEKLQQIYSDMYGSEID